MTPSLDSAPAARPRESFGSRFGVLVTMIGVAVGLGNVWRFPYMAGKFGGAPFVLVYIVAVLLIGLPALMAEWALGRHTRRGPVGAFERAGLRWGRQAGWLLFFVMLGGAAYYGNAVGWVLYHAVCEIGNAVGLQWNAADILPPLDGIDPRSMWLQMVCTAVVTAASGWVVHRGLRAGIERTSKVVVPLLLVIVTILVVRSLTLPGAWAGVQWYILKFEPAALSGGVVMAAIGQAVFSLSLGGTFMLVYGSYLAADDDLRSGAVWTSMADLFAGLVAGLAIVPAVMALGMDPAAGPGLLFDVLPRVFERMPAGWLFGLLFYTGLFGAAYLSSIAAFEVLVAGIVDNSSVGRGRAVRIVSLSVFGLALVPMINMRIFVPWDLTFGSGMQTVGALLSVVTLAWVVERGDALRELASTSSTPGRGTVVLYYWLRFAVPGAIVAVWVWWLTTDVLGLTAGS